MKLFCDIGHARRTGANGTHNGKTYQEHDICETIAPLLKAKVESMGHTMDIIDYPHLTNQADLNRTIATINAGGYDLGVSLHTDWDSDSVAHGAHVCYTSRRGSQLAACIAHHLCKVLPGRAEPTVHRDNLAVLTKTRPVNVIPEMGFITNPGDLALMLRSPGAIADAIARGIGDYLYLLFRA